MRTSPGRLLASASFLFVCGLALQQCAQNSDQAQDQTGIPFRVVASVGQVMDAIVIPSSQRVFDAVVYTNGELVASPKTNEEWAAVQMNAVATAEAANLLMMPPRAIDNGEWMTLAVALNTSSARAADAARRKNVDDLLKAGSAMYDACTACHEAYIPEDLQR